MSDAQPGRVRQLTEEAIELGRRTTAFWEHLGEYTAIRATADALDAELAMAHDAVTHYETLLMIDPPAREEPHVD